MDGDGIVAARYEMSGGRLSTYERPKRPGFVKLAADTSRRVLVGAVAVGPEAGEWLGQLTLAIRAEIPVDVLLDTIQPYPTFSEAIFNALLELRRARRLSSAGGRHTSPHRSAAASTGRATGRGGEPTSSRARDRRGSRGRRPCSRDGRRCRQAPLAALRGRRRRSQPPPHERALASRTARGRLDAERKAVARSEGRRWVATQWNGPVLTLDGGRHTARPRSPRACDRGRPGSIAVEGSRSVAAGRRGAHRPAHRVRDREHVARRSVVARSRCLPWQAVGEVGDEDLSLLLGWAQGSMRSAVAGTRLQHAVYRRAGRGCRRCGTPIDPAVWATPTALPIGVHVSATTVQRRRRDSNPRRAVYHP